MQKYTDHPQNGASQNSMLGNFVFRMLGAPNVSNQHLIISLLMVDSIMIGQRHEQFYGSNQTELCRHVANWDTFEVRRGSAFCCSCSTHEPTTNISRVALDVQYLGSIPGGDKELP